jgi:V8-like Glu-specific endopeptidase
MKTKTRFAFCVIPFLTSIPSVAAEVRLTKRTDSKSLNLSPQGAVGVVDVFLFKDRKISQRCTATHVGDGLMVTAGHCFMGTYDCNDAKVSWENEDYTSRCQYVLYSNASESYSNGSEISNDLTVFKIDKYPQAKAVLQPAAQPAESSESNFFTEAIAFSKRHSGSTPSTVTSSPCRLVHGPVVNIFSQPKPSDTVRHNCELSDIASGSPLMRLSNNELLAIHQGSSLLPDPDGRASSSDAQKIHYAKVVTGSDLRRILKLP